MIDALVLDEICEDPNFRKLAEDKTSAEEFSELIDFHVYGYSQKKRLCDGLKAFVTKVEEAENKLIVMQNVGKFKGEANPDVIILTSGFSSHEVKAKWSSANAQLTPMIEAGSITSFEKRHVIDNLRARLDKAKEAGKAKLEEKLDSMLSAVVKAGTFNLPVSNLEQFHLLEKEIHSIEKLAKLNTKTLSKELQRLVEKKEVLEGEFEALIDTSRMWFETVVEFKARLHEALADFVARQQERIRQMEAEALEKQIREDNEAIERKRLEAKKKEDEKNRLLDEQLKERREAAAAAPVKEVPKAAPKDKKVIARVNLADMFHVEQEDDDDTIDPAEIAADLEAKRLEKEREERKRCKAATNAEHASNPNKIHAAPQSASHKPSAKASPKTGPAEKPLKLKTDSQIAKEEELAAKKQEEKAAALAEKLAAKREAAESKPAKEPGPAPKKKEKKTATKMSLLDFYGAEKDGLLDKLAAQEAQEKAERAAAKLEAEKEAARSAAEEEAAWEAEEAEAWDGWEEEEKAAPAVAAPSVHTSAPVPTPSAPKAKPKAVRKPPVVIESRWGAPVEQAVLDDDLLERLAVQEAKEKIERAKQKAIDEEEAALLAAEEDEMWAELPPTKIVGIKAPAAAAPVIADPTGRVTTASLTLAPKPKRKPPVEKASMWSVPQTAAPEQEDIIGGADEDGEETVLAAGPSLADSMPSLSQSMTMPTPKKSPAPQANQPKKKEKKKWGKVDANLLGLDADNLNM